MADIELVIKIPEDLWNKVNNTFPISEGYRLAKCVKNGTPLPKGHGRLIDENELKKEAIRCEWSKQVYDMLDHKLSYMKPIIDADANKEEN